MLPSTSPLHAWDLSVPEAMEVQRRLRERLIAHPRVGFAPRLVAGADISMDRGSTRGYAAIVVIDVSTMQTVESTSATATLGFPYVPGLLAFRELPAVTQAWDLLETRPDVLIFDGAGYAHPRRFGLACHGGVLFDTPSIGCAKSILVGKHGPLARPAGSTADLIDKGEVVGMALRLRDGASPVYVSVGHLIDLATAVSVVRSVTSGSWQPETTRRAHQMVNDLRRRDRARLQE